MKLIQNILTNNDCYKDGRTINVQGLMLHSVGCPQPDAQVFLNNWNRSGVAACVHAFIDGNDGTVYQTLPWNHRGWHGGGASNNTHIGVEMCEPATITYTGGASWTDNDPAQTKQVVMRTYAAAVELFAYLCDLYHLNPLTQIISHAEGYRLRIATPHADVEHIWHHFGLTMDQFRLDVKAAMTGGSNQTDGKVLLDIDGSFGPATVRRTQQFLGVGVDGIVSNQPLSNKKYLYSAYDGCWEFKASGYAQGSNMVRALQALIGAEQDGWFGQESVMKLQAFLGVTQDGSMGPATVKAWQTYLNEH